LEHLDESDPFIFVKSITEPRKTIKKPAWPARYERTEYVPIGDDEIEWVSNSMEEQIKSTVSSFEEKKLKDDKRVYLVLGISAQYTINDRYPSRILKYVFYPEILNVLTRLSAEIISYLNDDHTRILISCPLSCLSNFLLKKKYETKYFQNVKRIGPLLPDEQLSSSLFQDKKWLTESTNIVIQLIPNLDSEILKLYSKSMIEYLRKTTDIVEPIFNNNFILTNLGQEQTDDLLRYSNFVFKVSEAPKGMSAGALENAGASFSKLLKTTPSDRPINRSSLPVICILDSGVNDIPPLKGFLVARDGYRQFPNFDDDLGQNGHGTPIAYIAAFGDDPAHPKARIASYKIFSGINRNILFEGYQLAILKYSSSIHPLHSRIFLSSIVFERYNDGITAAIDKLIQENNICAVFSAGNIAPSLVAAYLRDRVPCRDYVHNHPIFDPAQGVNIVAIGSIAKRESDNSVSRKNELSPFTTCGKVNGCLYDCQKPEFVQHGGNLCYDGVRLGMDTFSKTGIPLNTLVGTSFSAPLFANRLAEIFSKCGGKIDNAESLKAVALALSNGEINGCMGFGEVKSLKDFSASLKSIICAEGTIPLPDTISEAHYRTDFRAHISIVIPKFVNSIKLFLVHSDNHFKDAMPHLNTFLKVRAEKTGREHGSVDLGNPDEIDRKTNMKVFKWEFQTQSMEGTWDFYITPEITADMPPEERRATTIRYGCAFLINSKSPVRSTPLTQEINTLNQRMGLVRD